MSIIGPIKASALETSFNQIWHCLSGQISAITPNNCRQETLLFDTRDIPTKPVNRDSCKQQGPTGGPESLPPHLRSHNDSRDLKPCSPHSRLPSLAFVPLRLPLLTAQLFGDCRPINPLTPQINRVDLPCVANIRQRVRRQHQ